LGISAGFRSSSESAQPSGVSIVGTDNLALGFGYSYWVRENLAITFTHSILTGDVKWNAGSRALSTEGVTSALFGARLYFKEIGSSTVIRPYVIGGVGPYLASVNESGPTGRTSSTTVSGGGEVGAGMDFQLSRSLMLGARGGYDFMSDFANPLAGKTNYGGFELVVEVSWLFGKGRSNTTELSR
jgi:hypothetical protein